MGASRMSQLTRIAEVRTAENDEPETLLRCAADADYFFTCYAPISAGVIDAAPRLRGIVKYGVGTDSIDLGAASRRGIPVVHCPDYGTESVAEHAFALMMAVARKMSHVDRDLRRQTWLWPHDDYIGTELRGKTLGLIGFGRIGKVMARQATGFAMNTLAYDPYVKRNSDACALVEFAPLDEVVRASDILSLHCVLTAETRKIINANRLAMMKRHAILVNVSRGALIDQDALGDAFELGRDGSKAIEQAERVMYDCMSRGLSFKVSSGNVLTLTPPLVITDEQMGRAIETIEWAIALNSVR